MVFLRFSIGSGRAEKAGSQNLSLGWPSVWRAKVVVFFRFSIGFGSAENRGSQNLSLGWPSVWGAKCMVFHRFSIGSGCGENPDSQNLMVFLRFSIGWSAKVMVFLRFWLRRKSGLAEFELRLALSMGSKSNGFP